MIRQNDRSKDNGDEKEKKGKATRAFHDHPQKHDEGDQDSDPQRFEEVSEGPQYGRVPHLVIAEVSHVGQRQSKKVVEPVGVGMVAEVRFEKSAAMEAQMPFADERGRVAGLFSKERRERSDIWRKSSGGREI